MRMSSFFTGQANNPTRRNYMHLFFSERGQGFFKRKPMAVLFACIFMTCMLAACQTDKALTLMLGKLADLSDDPGTQIAILNQSIMNNWAGVFPLKGEVGPNGVKLAPKVPSILDGIL